MGFAAIYPAPAGRPTTADSTRTSSSSASSCFDGRASYDAGHRPGHSLEAPSRRHRAARHGSSSRSARLFQKLRHALPALALTPRCGRLQVGTPAEVAAAAAASSSSSAASSSSSAASVPKGVSFSGASSRPCRRVTGTLYGHRRGRVVLALQETPRCLPSLVVELALQTHALLRKLGIPAGARIVLETQRRPASADAAAAGRAEVDHVLQRQEDRVRGAAGGHGRRPHRHGDAGAVSMGAGVLPGTRCSSPPADAAAADDELPYLRGCFDHFVGSRDSESLYMVAPQGGGTGPELAVFFVRL